MRFAVYSIARNEERNVARWAASCADADAMLVCDTGSEDGTVEQLRQHGVQVHRVRVQPFRFDIARNTALALIPGDIDYCISLDLDEVLPPRWREHLEKAGAARPTLIHHRFVTYWPNGAESRHYHERIHARDGYRWVLPVHEKLIWYPNDRDQKIEWALDLEIEHRPDRSKDRSAYLRMIEEAITEPYGKEDWKIAYFLADGYWHAGRYRECAATARACLAFGDEVWPEYRGILNERIERCEHVLKEAADPRPRSQSS